MDVNTEQALDEKSTMQLWSAMNGSFGNVTLSDAVARRESELVSAV